MATFTVSGSTSTLYYDEYGLGTSGQRGTYDQGKSRRVVEICGRVDVGPVTGSFSVDPEDINSDLTSAEIVSLTIEPIRQDNILYGFAMSGSSDADQADMDVNILSGSSDPHSTEVNLEVPGRFRALLKIED